MQFVQRTITERESTFGPHLALWTLSEAHAFSLVPSSRLLRGGRFPNQMSHRMEMLLTWRVSWGPTWSLIQLLRASVCT